MGPPLQLPYTATAVLRSPARTYRETHREVQHALTPAALPLHSARWDSLSILAPPAGPGVLQKVATEEYGANRQAGAMQPATALLDRHAVLWDAHWPACYWGQRRQRSHQVLLLPDGLPMLCLPPALHTSHKDTPFLPATQHAV